MSLNCPYCRQPMLDPVFPSLPPEEDAVYRIVLQGGPGGVHKIRIRELMASQHGFDVTLEKIRKLVHQMNTRTLYLLNQVVHSPRHAGIYKLWIKGEEDGPTAQEPAAGTDV